MATTSDPFTSVSGLTFTNYKGIFVMSAKSRPYPHAGEGGGDESMFTGVRVKYGSTPAPIVMTNDVPNQVNFLDTNFDTDGYWDDGTPNVLTVPAGKGGVFIVGYSFQFQATALDEAQYTIQLLLNGSLLFEDNRDFNTTIGLGEFVAASYMYELAEGDTIEVQIQPESPGIHAYLTGTEYSPVLFMGHW